MEKTPTSVKDSSLTKEEKKENNPSTSPKTGKTKDELPELKGKYVKAVGRRKTSVAQVRIYEKGNGNIVVNGVRLNKYFKAELAAVVSQPLKLTGHISDFDVSVVVKGGGDRGQAEAIRHGIARILVMINSELKSSIKTAGWLTRDSRRKERKKPGLRKARRAPQWSKR